MLRGNTNWRQRIEDEKAPLNLTLVVGVCTFMLVLLLWQAQHAYEQTQIRDAIQAEADHLSMQIEQSLNARILALDRMAKRWEFESVHNIPQTKDKWATDANNYILHQPEYHAIAWADSSFHVRWAVPLQGNEELQDLDLTLKDEQRVAMRLAFTSRAPVTSRSTGLIQARTGRVVYVPMFNGDNFIGLIVGIFHFKDLFDFFLSDAIFSGYSIKVFDGNEEIYSQYGSAEQPTRELTQIAEIRFYNTRWQLHIWPRPEMAASMGSNLPTLILTAGGVITLLLMISLYLTMTTRLHSGDILLAKQALEADITERKQVEESLQSSEKRFRVLYDDNPSMLFTVDEDGKVLSVNQFGINQLGYSKDQLVGKSMINLFHEEDKPLAQEYLKQCFAEPDKVHNWELRKIRQGGTVFYVRETVRVVGDFDCKPTALIMCEDITERKQAEKMVLKSRERLRNLATRLHAVREEERMSIAREIHDELGQTLTGLRIDLAWILEQGPKRNKALIERARASLLLVDETLETVRRISHELRPAMLDDLGLEAAIEWQIEEFSNRTSCDYKFNLKTEDIGIDDVRDTVVFRILQEALTNAARHAKANQVNVSLSSADGRLVLEVADNGCGITKAALESNNSIGLIGMWERAGSLGGKVDIKRDTQGGTKVKLDLPLKSASIAQQKGMEK